MASSDKKNEKSPDDQYKRAPETVDREDVPKGAVHDLTLPPSKIYPGYTHRAWLYVPAQVPTDTPLTLMVFLDGEHFLAPEGAWRIPSVLNNLIAQGQLPPMAAVFIDHGQTAKDDGLASEQRSLEYDTLNGDYARFLIDEVLPAVNAIARVTDDPNGRGIAGMSSGGICAFTVAWQRPDAFRKVFSAVGSFVDIRGGGAYPALIRRSKRKPIRVFLQDGTNDAPPEPFDKLDWPAGTRAVARALALKGYDFQVVMGVGTHDPKHGASILPAALRWLWRDMRGQDADARQQDEPVPPQRQGNAP